MKMRVDYAGLLPSPCRLWTTVDVGGSSAVEIQHLKHLVAASESASFAKAAKKCFTSRQNIAHSIKVLENKLGTVLFERRGNEMVLTPDGEEAASAAREIVEQVENFDVMFAQSVMPDDMLTLAVSANLFAGIPSSTDEFIHSYSNKLRIRECDCEKCYELVLAERVDLAIVMCMKREFPECDVREIASSRSYAVVNTCSPLAQRDQLSMVDFKGQELLLMSKPPFQYKPLFSQMKDLGFEKGEVNVITSTSSMVHMVRRYDVMGLVSKKFAIDPPKDICAIPVEDPRLDWHFYALFRMDVRKFAAISKFVKGVRSTFESDSNYVSAMRTAVDDADA